MTQKPLIKPDDIWSGDYPIDWSAIDKYWVFGQKPPYTVVNYLQNQVDSALVHLWQNGIPQYDEFTMYQPGARCLHNKVLYKYTGTLESAGTDPSILPATVWTVDEERGGVAWNSATTYAKGDLVINPGSAPMSVYISVYDSNINQPITDTNWWQEVGSEFYNATTGGSPGSDGLHNPSSTEYPVTTNEIIGAIWTITGLGIDANLEPIHYTMTTGPLSGQIVKDEDTFTWTSGTAPNEVWLLTKKAVVSGETGGILYKNTTNYVTGDIVGHDDSIYIALIDTTNETPDTNPSIWEKTASAGDLVQVIDNLTSTSALDSLSANQGRILNEKKADLDSPTFIGSPTVPHPSSGSNDNSIATTSFVSDAVAAGVAGGAITIDNNLTSTSTTNALSGNMGKVLNDKKIEVDNYATATKGGTLKVRVSSGTLYMTTNGNNP